jgi:hypothetical protein
VYAILRNRVFPTMVGCHSLRASSFTNIYAAAEVVKFVWLVVTAAPFWIFKYNNQCQSKRICLQANGDANIQGCEAIMVVVT